MDPGFGGSVSAYRLTEKGCAAASYYALARRMLGATTNPKLTFIDDSMKEYSEQTGSGRTFEKIEGQPGLEEGPCKFFAGIVK